MMEKKEKRNEVIAMAEEAGLPMTYHQILMIVELFLCVRNVLNLVTSLLNPSSMDRTVDQIFYVIMLLIALLTVVFHDHKKGVISLHIFIAAELAWTLFICFESYNRGLNIPGMNEKMFSWILGSVLWFVPTLLYYRKRWRFLK